MASLGGIIGNPFFQWLLSQMSTREQSRVQDQYEQETDADIADVKGLARDRTGQGMAIYNAGMRGPTEYMRRGTQAMLEGAGELPGQYSRNRSQFLQEFGRRGDDLMEGYESDLGGFMGNLAGQRGELDQGYTDRYRMAEQELEGYGEQQQADIGRRFADERGAITQGLISRGLLSSTEAGHDLIGSTERESAEQRRLGEDLMRNRVNVLGGMSGERLGALERMFGQEAGYGYGGMQAGFGARSGLEQARAAYDAAMRGDVLGSQERLFGYQQQAYGNMANFGAQNAANQSNLYMQGSGDWLNTMMNINRVPPPQNQIPWMAGQNSVQGPQAPTDYSWMPGAGAGAGSMAGLIGAMMVPGASIPLSMLASGTMGGLIGTGVGARGGRW
jgi:hypothetical protein